MQEQQKIQEQLEQIQNEIHDLPEGKLLCAKNNTRIKWYKSNGANPIYIPKKDYKLAQTLALRTFYELQIEELSFRYQKINYILQKLIEHPIKSTHLLDSDSPYQELLSPFFELHISDREWLSAAYHTNPYHEENLIFKCMAGHKVRSKSEVIIANALYMHGIPYRYECELCLDETILFPDFTMRHPKTKDIVYWEHYGLMDNTKYRNRALDKMRIYGDHGIIPSVNLITTYETARRPLDSEWVEELIHYYFG